MMPTKNNRIEELWIKQNVTKPSDVLQISSGEWDAAKAVAKLHVFTGETPPFKLSKEELRILYPKHKLYLNHDLLVFPTENGPYELKIGVMARSDAYINEKNEETKEGILGHGAFGVVKIIQWEDGSVDAVKIEGAGKEEERIVERQIMKDLDYLRATFVERREKEEDWIGGKKIKDRLYTVQKIQAGIEMKNYFTSNDVLSMSPIKKYELGQKAALSIEQLHNKGILHCDIKPANFMVNWEGATAVVAAIDFGLSMRLEKDQTVIKGNPAGTPFYMAPEVAEYKRDQNGELVFAPNQDGKLEKKLLSAKGEYSRAADIFSLGIMFRDDLKLGEPDSPLHDLIKRMTAHDPRERPPIREVVMVTLNPDNYNKFKELYQYTEQYAQEKELKKSHSWASGTRINSEKQIGMAKELEEVIKQYRTAPQDDVNSIGETAERILSIMKKNQDRHQKSIFSGVSTFNIKVLQSLPVELRDAISGKLRIDQSSNIFGKINYLARKKLETLIKDYNPRGNIQKQSK